MKAISFIFVSFVLVSVAGCGATPTKVSLRSTFDRSQAEAKLVKGDNTIAGSGLIRKEDGTVVTCAGDTFTGPTSRDSETEVVLCLSRIRRNTIAQ